MSESTLTHKDLAREVGVSETTIKSYRRKFPGFVPVAGYGKPIRFKPEALDVCRAIRAAFDEGLSVGEAERRLKERFKQYPQPRPARDLRRSGASDAALQALAETLTARLDQFLEAQTRDRELLGQRLDRLEQVLNELAARGPEAPRATDSGETRVRAKKIVTVRSPEGKVDAYSLEGEEAAATKEAPEAPAPDIDMPEPAPEPTPEPAPEPALESPPEMDGETPPQDFLSLPVVIRTEQGEFLGVPGKLEAGPFVDVLEDMGRETGAVLSSWSAGERGYIFSMTRGDGVRLEHHFEPTTTPRGNRVANLARLDVDGDQADWSTLVEYFRRIKDRL